MPAASNEFVAVIGVGCRFPGGADTPQRLWQLLLDRRDTVGTVPPDRWNAAELMGYQHPDDAERYGRGCFVDGDIWAWEPAALAASPYEGVIVDPQHRLATEVAWEAIEHAGIPVDRVRGSRTGVYLGMYALDNLLATARPVRDWVDGLSVFGSTPGNAPGRISFALDLRGPSMAMETHCSSGLVAVHSAARALLAQECDMALAGGVMLMTAPETLHYEAQWLTSRRGKCYAFDERADGFVRGEGCGMVLLKRYADALADGDRILALLRGSAVTSDGQSERLTAPSTLMQQEAFRLALQRAGVEPGDVGLVEAHGPGTVTGDPIEYTSINSVYGRGRGRCALGSVKTNIGHGEPVSGVAGLIKAVQSVRYAAVPANLNFRAWHPAIPVDPESRLFVPVEAEPWPVPGGSRLAAVCSSGLAGTNAHVIVEQPPRCRPLSVRRTVPAARRGRRERPFPLSTASPAALPLAARRLADWVEAEHPPLDDLAHTLAVRRAHGDERLVVRAGSHAELVGRLRALAPEDGQTVDSAGVVTGRPVLPPHGPGPVFVFTGQGSQSPGMCQALLERNRAFTTVIDEIEPLMAAEAGFSVRRMITRPEELTGDDRIQPTLFAVQLGIAAMWRSWGIEPAAVIGLSLGEIIAAVTAGGLSLADGVRVICRRAKLARTVMGGAMASVLLDADQVSADLASAGADRVSLAVLTSPGTTVISGDHEQIEKAVADWQAQGISASVIRVDYASHSAYVDPILDPIRERTHGIAPRTPEIPIYGTAYEDPRRALPLDGDYWALNLREPVRFTSACAGALADGHRLFIECSPHPLAVRAIGEIAGRDGMRDVVALGSLRRDTDDEETFLDHVAAAHCAGARIDWPRHCPGRLVEAPPTTWHRTHLRPEPPYELVAPMLPGARQHSLLGGHVHDPDRPGRHLWQSPISPARVPWLKDHQVAGTPVMAGAGLCEMALSAGAEILSTDHVTVTGLSLTAPLLLEPEPTVTTRAEMASADRVRVDILTRPDGADPVVHARADVVRSGTVPAALAPELLHPQGWQEVSPADFYAYVRQRHQVVHRSAFAGLERIQLHPERDESLVTLRLPDEARVSAWMMRIHPALLDETVQAAMAVWRIRYALEPGPAVVAGFGRVALHGRAGQARLAHLRLTRADELSCTASGVLTTADGQVVAEIEDLNVTNITPPQERFARRLFHITHQPAPRPAPTADPGRWLLLSEPGDDSAKTLADALTAQGAHCRTAELPRRPEIGAELRALAPSPDASAADNVVLVIGRQPDGTPARDALCRTTRLCAALRNAARLPAPPRVWITVPCGAEPALNAAGVRGVIRTAAYEHPELAVSLLASTPDTPVDDIVSELLADDTTARETVLDSGQRLLARLAPASPDPVDEFPEPNSCLVRADGSYLVTGAFGGLGLFTLDWLARRGAGHIVAIGRSAPGRHAEEVLAAARANGVRITVLLGDIGERTTARQAVTAATQEDGGLPLRGVLHAAGVVEDATLDTLTSDLLTRVWHGKAEGAWHLHHATTGQPLDFWCVYSSAAALLGSPGQTAYAAANAFLDDLVAWRAARGLPATSIQWGAWARAGRGQHMANRGLTLIQPADGIDALDRIIATGQPQLSYAPIDLRRWLAPYPDAATSALFAETTTANSDQDTGTPLAEELLATDSDAGRRDLLHTHIIGTVRDLLGDTSRHITPASSLVMLGIDSLAATVLRTRLQRSIGVTIDPAVLWTKPTPAGLADWILNRMGTSTAADANQDEGVCDR